MVCYANADKYIPVITSCWKLLIPILLESLNLCLSTAYPSISIIWLDGLSTSK